MKRLDGLPKNHPRTYPYGIAHRQRKKPWIVKFKRNKRTIYVGSFKHYSSAVYAAEEYIRNEI